MARRLRTRGSEPPPREAIPLVAPDANRMGVCCSGGGVRSASYSLGALQVLREEDVLGRCAFVSAVSGGSYVASAFATTAALSSGTPEMPVWAPGSPEEKHLRNHSSYMAPGGAGKARLLLRILLGMAWNLAFVGALLVIVFWPLSWFYWDAYPQLAQQGGHGWLDVRWWMWVIPVAPLGVGIYKGLDVRPRTVERERDQRKRDALTERAILAAAVLAIVLLAIPQAVLGVRSIGSFGPDALRDVAAVGTAAAGANHGGDAAGLLGTVLPAALLTAVAGALSTFVARRRRFLLLLAAFVAGPLIVLGSVLAIVNAGALGGVDWPRFFYYVAGLVGALLFARIVDLTSWSLHPFYRRRLSSAFFVQRTTRDGEPTAVEVPVDKPLLWETLGRAPAREFPRLIVCAAANATEPGVTPPGRAAVPFVFTGERIGVPRRDVTPAEYRAIADPWRHLSVPAGVAMSGAAVSPLMGKKTIRAVRFLLALMNVRLGVWMPNPASGKAGERDLGARPNPLYLLKEMLGFASLDDEFLYVTDGGHFDNLGIIELLRRGCTTIFCLDGGGDPPGTYRALGEAVALARSELQVDIRIDPTPIAAKGKGEHAETDHVIGRFRYRATPDGTSVDPNPPWSGTIVYCRAAVTADAPFDVLSFAARDKRFPYHSTFDQLFDDEKFESYRALGAHTARRAIWTWREDLNAAAVSP